MIDINNTLQQAYYTALSNAVTVPVYCNAVPSNVVDDNYILFRSINNSDVSTNNSSDTDTSITVEIHTYKDLTNGSGNVTSLANYVFGAIYPTPQFNLTVDGVQVVSTRLDGDRTEQYQMNNTRMYISRYLTFRHRIFIN